MCFLISGAEIIPNIGPMGCFFFFCVARRGKHIWGKQRKLTISIKLKRFLLTFGSLKTLIVAVKEITN